MTAAKTLEERQRAHILYTWTAQAAASPVSISHGRGAVFWDHAGDRWLDFESQVWNCNVGHGEERISEAITRQARELACAHPAALFEAKAALGEQLAAITPGDMQHFFLGLSGAEANENAYKIARMVTGRLKVVARRRSYHGASMGALSLTGDPRRLPVEPGLWGVVRAEDPYCYRCPFGRTPDCCGLACAEHLERVIELEGPTTIAAVFMEGVTGANGGFVPPPGYWPRIREICDRHGILLVADEVLTGFGRTGRWFAVDHWGVVPDLMTMGKGVTGGYAPLGVTAVSPAIARYFQERTLWAGLTSYAHPISCAASVAAIRVYQEDGLVERAAALESVVRDEWARLHGKWDVIGDARVIGLLGTLELVKDRATREPFVPLHSPEAGTPMAALKKALKARRVHMLVKGNFVFLAPPLCITEAELREGIALIDDALSEVFGS